MTESLRRERGMHETDLLKAAQLLRDLDVDTLREIVMQGEREWVRVAQETYGAAGFMATFSREDLRVLFRYLQHVAWDKHVVEQAHDRALDRSLRSTLTPVQQQLYRERERAAAIRRGMS